MNKTLLILVQQGSAEDEILGYSPIKNSREGIILPSKSPMQ